MTTALAVLTMMLGSESWPAREAADKVLRWSRPFSDSALLAATRFSNPEISRRAALAMIGEPHFAQNQLCVGFRFHYNNYYVEIWHANKRENAYWFRTVNHGYVFEYPATRSEIERLLRECPQGK